MPIDTPSTPADDAPAAAPGAASGAGSGVDSGAAAPTDPTADPHAAPVLAQVLSLVRRVAAELRPQAQLSGSLGLDDSLERDFGLDSLARVELITRIGGELGLALSDAALTDAETPRDLLRFVTQGPAAATPGRATSQSATAATGHLPAEALAAAPPDTLATLVEVFDWHLQQHPQQTMLTLYEDTDEPVALSFAEMHQAASTVAAGCAALGLAAGERVAIMLPTGREFFAAFHGALRAGLVPVPLYPPARPSQLEDHLRRVAGILRNAQARLLITVERAKPLSHLLRAEAGSLQRVCTVDDLAREAGTARPEPVPRKGSDVAFLQYTSGSTGDPKGVILSHANLLINLRAMRQAARVTPADTFVSWLPLYHDMGLIGACLGSLVVGFSLVLMSPLAFLAKPLRWPQAIARHRGTLSAAPNFAYELCLSKLSDADLDGLDLSSWRLAFNGAEPVSPATLERFAARFARCGFKREALTPVYGLAENGLGLAFPPIGRGPRIDRIERRALAHDGRATPARHDDANVNANASAGAGARKDADADALSVVSSGLPLPGHELRIVDAGGRELPEREQGRVQFSGLSATRGYLDNPAANAKLFDGEWLNTGDLGYLAAGELYLTGREKDIIIRGGLNIHPQELEAAVAGLPGVRKGGVAVFAATDPQRGTEKLVVLAETDLHDAAPRGALVQTITALSATLLGAPADDVMLAPPRAVLKTSSGKIRRAACRALYEQGHIGRTQRAPWRQWLALAASAAGARTRRALHDAGRIAWGCWAWAVVVGLGALAWVLVMLTPGLARRQRATRAVARAAARLIALPLQVQGLEHLPAQRACVFVANHTSYADAILLGAVLPAGVVFAAKRELADTPLIGAALRRLGTAFVERAQAAQGVEDTHALQTRLRAGDPVFFFPEGTFVRASGLRPFKLGAFVVAAETGAPLLPVTLNGTRTMLRAGTWLPRRSPLRVTISAPLMPAGPGWANAIALRDAARSAMMTTLDEPAVD